MRTHELLDRPDALEFLRKVIDLDLDRYRYRAQQQPDGYFEDKFRSGSSHNLTLLAIHGLRIEGDQVSSFMCSVRIEYPR
jgi:hypothetical protein